MRPRALTAAIAEDRRRVVAGAREIPGERDRRVVRSPRRRAAMLEPVDAFPRQLVRPRAVEARRLVGAVEVEHDVVRRRLAQDCVVEIDHFLRLVIEEIDLRAGDAVLLTELEELAPRLRRLQIAAVLPQPDADVTGGRVLDAPLQ